MPSNEREAVINEKTKVYLPQVIALIVAAISFMGWQYSMNDGIKDRFIETNTQFADVKFQIAQVRSDLKTISENMGDRLSRAEFSQWVQLLSAKNPTLSVPEVRK